MFLDTFSQCHGFGGIKIYFKILVTHLWQLLKICLWAVLFLLKDNIFAALFMRCLLDFLIDVSASVLCFNCFTT